MASIGCHTTQHQTLQKKHMDVDVCVMEPSKVPFTWPQPRQQPQSRHHSHLGSTRNSGPAPVLSVG